MNQIVTQVLVFGTCFETISDDQAIEYLQREGGKIKRFRRKRCWMPVGRLLSFKIRDTDVRASVPNLVPTLKNAYVHFESAEATRRALRKAKAGRLRIGYCTTLRISVDCGNERDLRRRAFPLMFDDVAAIEIGNLNKEGKFGLVWRETNNPCINFVIDTYLRACYIRFIRDATFSAYISNRKRRVIIKCEVKIEFSMDQVSKVKVSSQKSSSSSSPLLVFSLLLTKPAALYYRTADDEIWSVPGADCLDDNDPWRSAGSKDFTSSGVVRSCLYYRIVMSPSYRSKLLEFLSLHLEE